MKKEIKSQKFNALSILSQLTKGTFVLLLGIFSFLSLISFQQGQSSHSNWIGLFGWTISYSLFFSLGIVAFFVPLYLFWLSIQFYFNKPQKQIRKKSYYFLIFFVSTSLFFAMKMPNNLSLYPFIQNKLFFKQSGFLLTTYYIGGIPAQFIYSNNIFSLSTFLGVIGSFLLISCISITSLAYIINISRLYKFFSKKIKKLYNPLKKLLFSFFCFFKNFLKMSFSKRKYFPENYTLPKKQKAIIPLNKSNIHSSNIPINSIPEETNIKKQLTTNIVNKLSSFSPPINSKYSLPNQDLLSKIPKKELPALKETLQQQALVLKETLSSFGLDVNISGICSGPTLTSFEVLPPIGVKVQKIKALENDLALNMQAKSIRIIAPIPGKAAVGIEIPNPFPQQVCFREILEYYNQQQNKLDIPLLLGKKSNGEPLYADLTKMPHLIIAGATGSGKSVCINTIVMSIIMTNSPDQVKLVMVDPKKVELSAYSQLPHMLTPVITEATTTYTALSWLVKEMELRYEILRFLGIRNIKSFNSRKIDTEYENSCNLNIPQKMPFIICIIDELSDLILSSSQDIETPIIRIAQMARAVGIHMILATQRPSREVITGLIKANFPSRISFKVASRVNSQIIIDDSGAESLIGNGDMLFLSPGTSSLIRGQGAFIKDEDINNVIQNICKKYPTNYVIPSFDKLSLQNKISSERSDPLFSKAKTIVLETNNASTTFLQRKLKIGYARAASLIDDLETEGIIGPAEGAKPRRILKKLENFD